MEKYFGLESFFRAEKSNLKHVNDGAILLVHWSLCNNGLLCVSLGDKVPENPKRSECLPNGWNKDNGVVYSIVYQDRVSNKSFLLKAVAAESMLIVSLMNFETEQTSDISISPGDFINLVEDSVPVISDLDKILKNIDENLVKKLKNSKGSKEAASKIKEDKKSDSKDIHDDPLLVGRRLPPRGIDPNMPDFGGPMPNIGGADLDPFRGGGIMGGGMLMDPRRGGRDIQPRWDPVGPGMGGFPGGGPGRGGFPSGGRGRGGFRSFGDEMPPPGFNDVSDDYNNMFM